MKTQAVMIIGSEGFIGKSLCNKIKDIGIDIIKIDKKIGTNIESIDNTMIGKVDVIIYSAGISHKGLGEQSPYKCFDVNIMDIVNLCEKIRYLNNKTKLIFLSSIDANDNTQAYGVSKSCAEKICEYYRNKGLIIDIVRLATVISNNMPAESGLMKLAKNGNKIDDIEIDFMLMGEVIDWIIQKIRFNNNNNVKGCKAKLEMVVGLVKELNGIGQ